MAGWEVDKLYNGCILVSIANALAVARYPMLMHDHIWDRFNYNLQNGAGIQGTITFSGDICVGAFRDYSSERGDEENPVDAMLFFSDAPDEIIELAKTETFEYLSVPDSKDDEKLIPYITTAFWGIDNKILSLDTLDNFLKNGGDILKIHTMDIEDAINELEDGYDMNDEQVALMKLMFERKIAAGDDEIFITKEESAMIGTPEDEEGREMCIAAFKQMNINIEI